MTGASVRLEVLLVDDDRGDLLQFQRDLPRLFEQKGLTVKLHPVEDFNEACSLATDPSRRYDLIVSDTYRGDPRNSDAQVMQMVREYRGSRFCPLVVYSSGVPPADFVATSFVIWADKGRGGEIERAICRVLDTGIPQIGRQLHNELDRNASDYLWGFLERKWQQLNDPVPMNLELVYRLVRRRAAVQIAEIDPNCGTAPLSERDAAEYYIYPALLTQGHFNLGDIVRSKTETNDLRVILTPHCHLVIQPGQSAPRADHVLTVKALPAAAVLGQRLVDVRNNDVNWNKKLKQWARSPAQTDGKPKGRHWFLPGFLDIPHSFCDFVQVQTVPYGQLCAGYERLATLASPYAEALQACFATYYSVVGIPDLMTASIE